MRRAEQPLPPRLATGGLDAEMMTAEASDTPLLPAASAPPRFRNAVTGDAVAGDAVLVEPRPMVRARDSLLHARLCQGAQADDHPAGAEYLGPMPKPAPKDTRR